MRCILTSAVEAIATNTYLEQISSGPLLVDPRVALESESAARGIVGALIDVALETIIPEQQRLVDRAADRERHLAVALAGGRRFQLCDALIEITAAISPEISCLRRYRTDGKYRPQDQREVDPSPYSPVHHELIRLQLRN